MEMILWRHADAEADETDDLSRELTERGRKQAARMAAWLTPRLPQGVRILVSPAVRAQQTARALGRAIETCDAIAPGCTLDELLAVTDWPNREETVLVVGHQPLLGQAAHFLLTGETGDVSVRKAGVWWFQSRIRQDREQVVLRAAVNPDWL